MNAWSLVRRRRGSTAHDVVGQLGEDRFALVFCEWTHIFVLDRVETGKGKEGMKREVGVPVESFWLSRRPRNSQRVTKKLHDGIGERISARGRSRVCYLRTKW